MTDESVKSSMIEVASPTDRASPSVVDDSVIDLPVLEETLEYIRPALQADGGDLILLGAWDGEQVICFEEQVASHGGLGGPQGWPFLAFPPGAGYMDRGIENAEDLYRRFAERYAVPRDLPPAGRAVVEERPELARAGQGRLDRRHVDGRREPGGPFGTQCE